LLPASRAIFPPDAFVGSITIRISDNEETFYFVPEVEKRRTPGKGVAPSMDRALQRFWRIAKGVTEAQEGANYE
jgi:DNA/RNA-binding domain of Phe-tRNA-synthetase-like protein